MKIRTHRHDGPKLVQKQLELFQIPMEMQVGSIQELSPVFSNPIQYIDREVKVYVDRIVEKEVEKPIYIDREVEKIQYIDRIVSKEIKVPQPYPVKVTEYVEKEKIVTVSKIPLWVLGTIIIESMTIVSLILMFKGH